MSQLPGIARVYTDRLFWMLQAGGWSAYSIERALSPGQFFPHGWGHLGINLLLTSLLHPVYWWLSLRRPPVWLLALAAVVGSAAAGVLMPVLDYLFPLVPPVRHPVLSWEALASGAVVHALTRDVFVPFLLWSAAYLALRQWDIARRDRERGLELAMAARRAELRVLHAQLNPHFLFNALNSIQALITEDPPRAARVLGQFSGFLAYSLRDASRDLVAFEEEMRAIEAFIAIQKTRFEEKLQVELAASPQALPVLVPPLLVYPLVENAVKYGMAGLRPARVRVDARLHEGRLQVDVVNTGRWQPGGQVPGESGLGLGLRNVRERLAEIYPGRHRFTIGPADGGWVRASIEIDHE